MFQFIRSLFSAGVDTVQGAAKAASHLNSEIDAYFERTSTQERRDAAMLASQADALKRIQKANAILAELNVHDELQTAANNLKMFEDYRKLREENKDKK